MNDAATVEPTIYEAPNIRKQTLQDAEKFLEQKRVRRLILLHSAKEKAKEKAAALQGTEKAKFEKLSAQFATKIDKISEEISRAETILRKMHETNHALANIETILKDE